MRDTLRQTVEDDEHVCLTVYVLESRNGDSVLATEFGATSDVSTISQFLDGFNSQLIPWLFWDYSVIAVQPTSSGETSQQAAAALKALARPYPYAVAGIPVSYSFDSTSREFALSYTSHHTDGEPFPSGTDTEVITPKITYPDGYRISADGATVTSQRCAPLLVAAASSPINGLPLSTSAAGARDVGFQLHHVPIGCTCFEPRGAPLPQTFT